MRRVLAIFAICTVLLVSCVEEAVVPNNPILKIGDANFLYVADPAAEVFNGKVYVYCSHDQPDAKNYGSMQDYVVLESEDMKTWTNHGVVLKPREYSWAQGQMNAPDAAYKDGWYYYYFPYDKTHVGVAKSRNPEGPWEEAVADKITTIFDPTVFVDDDGQAYIYGNDHKVDIGDKGWHLMGAKLKDNMVELDGEWQRLSEEQVNEAVPLPIQMHEYVHYRDILIISRNLRRNDGLIFVLSRKLSPSYVSHMAHIPQYINNYFSDHSFILVYPYQTGAIDGELKGMTNVASICAVSKIEDVIDSVINIIKSHD